MTDAFGLSYSMIGSFVTKNIYKRKPFTRSLGDIGILISFYVDPTSR